MNKRKKQRLLKFYAWLDARSRERMIELDEIPKDNISRLSIDASDVFGGSVSDEKEKVVLKWRKHRKTQRSYPYSRRKRILVVETMSKNKKVYTISGLNEEELNKTIEAVK